MCGSSDETKETPEEIALAEIAVERYNRYQEFKPVENQLISGTLEGLDSPDDFAPSQANLATQNQFSRLEPQIASGLTQRGAGPGSAAFDEGIIGLNLSRTASTAQGQANAAGLERSRQLGNLQGLIGVGQGISDSGVQGMAVTADLANRQAILDSRAEAAARAAMGSVVGTGVGLGYGYATRPTAGAPQAAPSWTDAALSRGGFTTVDNAQSQWGQQTGNFGGGY